MSGTLTYWVFEGENRLRSLKLTVCSEDDRQIAGLQAMRRRRLSRLLNEAMTQGARLSYKDLRIIMLTSKATLKRDVSYLRKRGVEMPLKGNVPKLRDKE